MMFDPQTIGNRIFTLRKAKEMTQAELAKYLNVSHQAVSKWERGESLPELESLFKYHCYRLS